MSCIEDEFIKKANMFLQSNLEKMKNVYGHQIITYPDIKVISNGSVYKIEFIIGISYISFNSNEKMKTKQISSLCL